MFRQEFASTARLGLALVVWLGIEAATGAGLWAGRNLLWMPAADPIVLGLHVYAGLLSVAFVLGKIWVTLPRWPWPARAPSPAPGPRWVRRGVGNPPELADVVASAVLVVLSLAIYASGLALYLNLAPPDGNELVKAVHLDTTLLAVPPVTWHLMRYLGRSWQAVQPALADRLGRPAPALAHGPHAASLREARLQGEGQAAWGLLALLRRREFLAVGLAALVAVVDRALAGGPAATGAEDPNGFPVTTFYKGATQVDLASWRLRVTGAVERPLELSYADLLALPWTRARYNLHCVNGWTAIRTWRGVPLSALLQLAGARADYLSLQVTSVTGYVRSVAPPTAAREGALVSTHVEDVPYSPDHGFPARLILPDVVGEDCVKWLAEIKVVAANGPA